MKGWFSKAGTFSSGKTWFALVVILIISFAFELYGRQCGFIFTSDSHQYLSAARSFSEHGKFLSPEGTYYSYWQPMFPIILSFSDNPVVLAEWLNLICKISLGISFLLLANHFIKKSIYKIIFLLLSLCNVTFIMISVFLWSELLFMTFAFLNLYFALHIREKNYFYYLIVSGFLMCLQRNAGLFWAGGVSLWLLFDSKEPILKKISRSGAFFILSTSGFWIWNIYNTFFISADFSFYKHSFFQDFFFNMNLIAVTLTRFFLPVGNWVLFIIGATVILFLLRSRIDRNMSLIVCLLSVYIAGFASMSKLDVYDMDRYFSIVFPLAFLSVILSLEKITEKTPQMITYAIIFLTCIWLIYPFSRTLKNVQSWHERSCLTESTG